MDINSVLEEYHQNFGGWHEMELDRGLYYVTIYDNVSPLGAEKAKAWLSKRFALLTQTLEDPAIAWQRKRIGTVHRHARCG